MRQLDKRRIRRMYRLWGRPCPDYFEECASCAAWFMFDLTGFIAKWQVINLYLQRVKEKQHVESAE